MGAPSPTGFGVALWVVGRSMLFLALYSYFVGYLSELILRTRIPIILFCLSGIWGWRACCASGRRAASTTAWFVGRAGAWGERGGGAGRIIVLDDPGGAFAVRWVLALLGWADANVFWGRGGVARGACSAWDGGRWALRRMGGLDQLQDSYSGRPQSGLQGV